MNNDFTFLSTEQIFGDAQLDILKKYGTKCAVTDFSIILGAYVGRDTFTSEGRTMTNRTGGWWTKTTNEIAYFVDDDGKRDWSKSSVRNIGGRPVLPYSSISSISSNKVRGQNGILEVEYGEYPQTAVSQSLADHLERLYCSYFGDNLKYTGKSYTIDANRYLGSDIPFQAETYPEYEYFGEKYVRICYPKKIDTSMWVYPPIDKYNYYWKYRPIHYYYLSNYRKFQAGGSYWVKVEPIKWMIDEKANIALSKKIIFSGIQFNKGSGHEWYFKKTDIKKFMDEYFSKDIIPSYSREVAPDEKKQIESKMKQKKKSIRI